MELEEPVVDGPPLPLPFMEQILLWIGFNDEATRNRLQSEGFETYDDLFQMKEKDIRDLAESYNRRTIADGRAIFGLRRTRYLIGLIHWVQDFRRVGEEPTIDGFVDALQFRLVLDKAYERANVRKVTKDQADTVSKAADPGKFKDERKWPEWEPAFVNYLSTLPGVTGIPLSYVVRELEEPDRAIDYASFNEKAIACAPLVGSTYQADATKVHQLLKSFLQSESAEQWIKPFAKAQDGRKDMEALRGHYSGEGNTSRRIAVAERYRDTLHYKNEKALAFSSFLDKIQTMFNIFETEGEPIQEQAKIRMLLKTIEHPALQTSVETLRVRSQMDNTTFTECANFLSAKVSELPDYQLNRRVSATDTKHKTKRIRGGGSSAGASIGSKRKGIHMPDGSVWTGYYSDWEKMSEADKQTVMDTRKKNKATGNTPNKKRVSDVHTQLAEMKKSNAEIKKTIAALKSNASKDDDTASTSDSTDSGNAGDCFGGRRNKKSREE
jgi:hypothetical protein